MKKLRWTAYTIAGVLLTLVAALAVDYHLLLRNTLSNGSTIVIEGSVVQYKEHGSPNSRANNSIVILHGTPGGYDQFNRYGEWLTDSGYHVIIPSRDGYLRTESTQATFEQQADSLSLLLRELNVSTATVVGISGGGPIALQFALRHSNQVSALILVAALTDPTLNPAAQTSTPPSLSFSQNILFYLLSHFPTLAAEVDPSLPDEQRSNIRLAGMDLFRSLTLYDNRQTGYLNDWQQFEDQRYSYSELQSALATLQTPVLAIHGTEDSNVEIEHSESLINIVPHGRLIEVPEATHLFLMTEIEFILSNIVDFIEAQSPN